MCPSLYPADLKKDQGSYLKCRHPWELFPYLISSLVDENTLVCPFGQGLARYPKLTSYLKPSYLGLLSAGTSMCKHTWHNGVSRMRLPGQLPLGMLHRSVPEPASRLHVVFWPSLSFPDHWLPLFALSRLCPTRAPSPSSLKPGESSWGSMLEVSVFSLTGRSGHVGFRTDNGAASKVEHSCRACDAIVAWDVVLGYWL